MEALPLNQGESSINKTKSRNKGSEVNNQEDQKFKLYGSKEASDFLYLLNKEDRIAKYQLGPMLKIDAYQKDNNNLNAIDHAWLEYIKTKNESEKSIYEKVILNLLESNSKFPSESVEFSIKLAPELIQNFKVKCENFHKYVENDENETLQRELNQNNHLRYIYDENNESLLLFTLKNRKINFIKIFDGALSIGPHENINEIFYKFSKRETVKDKLPKSHIIILKSMSMILNIAEQNHQNWKLIEDAFNRLDEIEICSKILKIVPVNRDNKIYFDFDEKSNYEFVKVEDARLRENFEPGTIYVCAKNITEEPETFLSSLIAKFCTVAISMACLESFDLEIMNILNDEQSLNESLVIAEDSELAKSKQNKDSIHSILGKVVKMEFDKYNPHLYDYFINCNFERLLKIVKILYNVEQYIDYKNLTKTMKAKILKSNVNFQEVETSLLNIIGSNLNVLNNLTAEDIRNVLLQNKALEIENQTESSNKCNLIDRRFIQKFETYPNDEEFMNFEQVKLKVEIRKIFILSDKSGTGKTTAFLNLKSKLKNYLKTTWVSFIKLRDHQEVKTVNEHRFTLELILHVIIDILNIKSNLEVEIFKQLFHEGRVIFLLDGFDEINQDVKSFWIKLKSLINKEVETIQFWISTRPPISKELLDDSIVDIYELAPLSQADKLNFIHIILKEMQFSYQQEDIPQDLKEFLEFIEHKGQFSIDNLLFLETIVKFFVKNTNIFDSVKINEYEVFEQIYHKQQRIFNDKVNIKNIDPFEKFPIHKVHQVFAIKLFFNNKAEAQLQSKLDDLAIMKMWKKQKPKWTSERIQFYGFLSINLEIGNDVHAQPTFNHWSFVEFFVAQYIASYVYSDDDCIREEEFKKVLHLLRTIAKPIDDFENVRRFFLGYLKHHKTDIHPDMKQLILQNIIRIFKGIFSQSNPSNTLNFWLEILIDQDKILQKLGGSQHIKDMINDEFIEKSIILQMLMQNNSSVYNFNHLSFALNKNINEHKLVWNYVEKHLDKNIKRLFFEKDVNGNNYIHNLVANNSSNIINFSIQKIKDNFEEFDFQKILRSKGEFGRNLLQTAAVNSKEVKIHQILWKELRELCKSDEEFLKILVEIDENGDNVCGLAATFSTEKVLKFMQEELEKFGSKEKFKDLLMILEFAIRHFLQRAAQQNKSLENHEYMWKVFKNYFDSFDILKLIQNNDGTKNDNSDDSIQNSIKFNEKFFIKLINQGNQDIKRNAKQSCKVLQISTELDIDQKLAVISTLQPSEYPSLFIFIFQHKSAKFMDENQRSKARQLEEYLIKFGAARPLVLLHTFEDENETKFYYKAENSTQFVDIDQHYSEDLGLYEEYKESLQSFLEQDLEPFEDEILQKLSWIKDSSKVLRFLRTLNIEEAYFSSIVFKIAENGSKADLLAGLDASFKDNGRNLSKKAKNYLRWVFYDDNSSESSDNSQSKEDLGSEISSDEDQDDPLDGTSSQSKKQDSSQSVLMTAVQHSNKEIIDYLITYCTHLIQQLPFEHQIRISSAAFSTNQLNILCDLLDTSDFPFPDQFTFSKSKINENLQKITEERMEFKAAIERGDFAGIDNFIDKNLRYKFIYSIDNNSALTEAVNARQFGVFYYLKSLGLQGENCQDILAGLTKEERTAAVESATKQRNENIKSLLKNPKWSIYNLCGKSLIHNKRISKELEAKYRENIKDWFVSIHKIAPEMLEVAATCENLKIIFDFESHNVENASFGSQYSSGASYPTMKWIFIGAKFINKVQKQKVKGVLAHELCHYVMALVYENQELPHFEQDKKTQEMFKEIVDELDKWSITKEEELDDECDGIISAVFRHYPCKEFGPELIVRVVNILAQYDNDPKKTEYLGRKYQVLFGFWYNHVVPEMLNYFKKNKVAIRVNATVGLLKSLSNTEIEFCSLKNMEQLMENKVTIVTTNVPRLLLINIYSHLDKTCSCLMKSLNLFLEPEKIKNEQVWTDLKDLHFRDVKLNVFVDCTKENLKNLSSILDIKEFNFILVAANEEQAVKLKRICSNKKINSKTVDINYKWNDLTENSQAKLLETKVKFQNNLDLPLKELLSKSENPDKYKILSAFSDIIDDQLFNLLIEKKEIQLNLSAEDQETQNKSEILYQERNFLRKGVSFKNEISQEKLISITADNKHVLISDIAGSGKSWVVKNISKIIKVRTPTRWVTYVDLKKFIEVFKEQVENFHFATCFASFFVDKILKPKTKFEAEIFKKLYKIGKVSIIFDAFDEIVPDCAEFVADLAKSFKFNGGNQLWIVTRDYFEVNLQQKLGIENVYKLSEFTEQEGINFIVTSWILTDFKNQKKIDFKNIAENSPNFTYYLEKATIIVQNVTVIKNQSIGLPQLFSIIADSYKNDKLMDESLSKARIFTQFVNTINTRWADHKGNLRKDGSIKSQHYVLGFMKFHQFCAIASLFPELINFLFPGYDKLEWSEAEIIACGIINKIGISTYSFIHETFREFFVADYIFKSMNDPKIINLLIQVLTIQKFGVIRTFLNDFIDNYSVLEKVESELKKSVEKFYKMENFSEYFTENQEHLAKLVIDVLKKADYENVKKLISNNIKKVVKKTKELKMFLTFTDFIFSFLENQDLMEIITNQNILHEMSGSDQKIEIFENFVSKLENKFGSEFVQQELIKMPTENETGNIFYHFGKSQNLSQQKAQKFFEIIQKYLNDDEVVELMIKCNSSGDTIFNVLVQTSRNFKPFFDGAESFLKDRNLFTKFKNIVCKTDSNDEHILHLSADKEGIEFHDSLWNFIHKTFDNQQELKAFVLQRNYWQNNFLNVLIIANKSDVIKFTFNKLKEFLKQLDYAEILRSEGGFGRNLLQCAVINSEEFETHQILWKKLRDSCKSDEAFLKLLGEVDEDGENVLGFASIFSTGEVLKFMQTELETIESKEKVKKLLTNLGFGRRHLLQAAARQNKSLELHKILWEILKNYFDSFEILEFIKHCDSFGNNLLLNVIEENTKAVKELTWNEVKKVLNRTELKAEKENIEKCEKFLKNDSDPEELQEDEKELLKLKWIKNENLKVTKLFDEATQKLIEQRLKNINLKNIEILQSEQNIENHRKLWEKCTETLKSHEVIEKLATEMDENGSNFLHLLVIYNTAEVIEFTLNNFKENLNESDFKKLLRSKGKFGRNLFQVAAGSSKEVKTHQILWKELRESCKSEKDFLEILEEVDEDRSDVFNLAAAFTTGEIFEFMYQELVKVASPDKIKNILTMLGIANQNLLQSAARQNKSLELLQTIWKILKKNFNSLEILEFFKHCDDYGDNLLIVAKKFSTKETIEFTWTEIKELLTKLFKGTETVEKIKECEKFIAKLVESKEKEESENKIEDEENLEEIKLLQLDWIKNLESQPAKLFSDFTQDLSENDFIIKVLNNLQQFATKKDIKIHSKFWNHLLKSPKYRQYLTELVSKRDEKNNNFIHLIVIYNTAEVLEFTLEMFKKNINMREYQEILRSKGQFGRNLLQCAATNSKEVRNHQIMWKELRESCKSDEEFLEILGEVGQQGDNILLLAATYSTSENLKFMQAELEKIGSKEKVKKLLTNLGFERRHLLQEAAEQNKSLELHKNLWEILKNYFDSFEILEFIKHCDAFGDNLLLNVIEENTKEVQELTWNEVKEILINVGCKDENSIKLCEEIIKNFPTFRDLTEEQKEILKFKWTDTSSSVKLFENYADLLVKKSISIKKFNDLMPFAGDANIENHKILWKHLESNFKSCEELKELFMEKDKNGNNFIHFLVIFNSANVIKFTIDKVKENLSEKDFQEVLRSKGQIGRNLLHRAAVNSKEIETHQILLKEFRKSCKSDEKFKKILEEVDENGDNVFHLAAAFTTSEVFNFMILEMVKISLIWYWEIKKLLASFGQQNVNLLQSAVIYNKNLETHKTIWKIFFKHFDTKEILELIEHRNDFGHNLLCCAVYYNTKEIVEFTWNQIKIFINTKEAQAEYLNRKGQNGKGLHQLALENPKNNSQLAIYVQQIMQECQV